MGILRAAGIPLHEALYDVGGREWASTSLRPDFVSARGMGRDHGGRRCRHGHPEVAISTWPPLFLVQAIKVKGALP